MIPLIASLSEDALHAVPDSLRQAAYGLGATRMETSLRVVAPAALSGISAAIVVAASRAVGETAPLLVVGAAAYVTFNPTGLTSKFTVLPMQIYEWARRPQQDFQDLAAAAIIVLLVLLLVLNGAAIFLRQRFSRKIRW